MKVIMLFALLATLTLCATGPVRADDESGWRLRFDLAFVDTGAGFGVRGEYQFSRRLGIDFGFLTAGGVDMSASWVATSSLDVSSFTPLIAGVNFHLTPDRWVDLYLGPQVALVEYSEVDFFATPGSAGTSVSIDRDLGFGAIVGLDVPLGENRHWAVQTSLRYLATSMEGSTAGNRVDVDFDPMIFSLGIGYRW